MSIVIGRLTLEDPESFPEPVGESVTRVGSVPVPSARSGLQVSAGLNSFTGAVSDTADERERVRRQLRSLLNNLPARMTGVYLAWTEDPEQDGWYVPGGASFDVAGPGGLAAAFWRFANVELSLIGRRRTHRRGMIVEAYDRRLETTPRDYLGTIYSDEFASMADLVLAWLPSTVTDPTLTSTDPAALTGARTGREGSSVQAVVAPAHNAVVSFEQADAYRNRGDVIAYDRRGATDAPTDGPGATWEELYGPDWPYEAPETDTPVLENSLCRVRWDATNTPGFAVDLWQGGAFLEVGKMMVRRVDIAEGVDNLCDTFVDGRLVEWSPERAVIRAVVRYGSSDYSREVVFVTLQRGWNGPRFEVYGAAESDGWVSDVNLEFSLASSAGLAVFKPETAVGDDVTVRQTDTVYGVSYAGRLNLGSAGWPGENWIAAQPTSGSLPTIVLATVDTQGGFANGYVYSSSDAYGSARNVIGVGNARFPAQSYRSVQVGFSAADVAGLALEAESMTLASGTSSSADGTASGGSAASATRTSEADHVTTASWRAAAPGKYRVLVRVRNATAGTLNLRAQTTATTGSVETTTSTTYVWEDLGEIEADGSTLRIRAWRSSAGTFYVDRVVAVPIEQRETGLYDGARDHGAAALHDVRTPLRIVPR